MDAGMSADTSLIAERLLARGDPITISGGEPFAQSVALADLVHILRSLKPGVHIIVYTGYTVENLIAYATDKDPASQARRYVLETVNTLVDGPYIARLDDEYIQWRGSRNQRPIDLRASTINWRDPEQSDLVLCDWDTIILTATPQGLLGPAGVMRELFDEPLEPARMCGQIA